MPPPTDTQIDLFAWARELEQENERIAKVNDERARRRGYLVDASANLAGYREGWSGGRRNDVSCHGSASM